MNAIWRRRDRLLAISHIMGRRWLFVLGGFVLLGTFVVLFQWHFNQRRLISAMRADSASGNRSMIEAFPTGVVVDSDGDIYVVARKQNRILEISAARRVTIVAGNGSRGFSGDGGLADLASLDRPVGIAVDPLGNLYIADTGNNRIRRVDAKTRIISTIAGTGSLYGGVGKIATTRSLYQPMSVAVDANENVYIGVTHGDAIKRVDAITHFLTNVIGAGLSGDTAALPSADSPVWVAVDARGKLFFSNPNRNAVYRVNSPGHDAHIIAGGSVCGFDGDGGPANGALLCFPEALSVSANQELFIADTGNNRIRLVDLTTGVITTVAGNGQAGYAGDGGLAINARLKGPMGIAVDRKGDVYIADTGNNCIRLLDSRTGIITTLADGSR